MSVETEAIIKMRPWAYNQVDKGLPNGVWYAQAAVVGDASGGHAEIVIVLNESALVRRSGRSFSIELSLPVGQLTTVDAAFRAVSLNMDILSAGNPIQKAWTQVADHFASTIEAPRAAVPPNVMYPSFFLGSQAASTADARLQGQFNNVDTIVFGWYASGYTWEPGAQNAPGGLRRPFNGVF